MEVELENLREILKLSDDPLGGAVKLNREMVERIDKAVEAALEAGDATSYLSMLNPLVQGKGAGECVLYSSAYLQARAGDDIVARQLFVHLCERLEQHKRWGSLSAVLERVLRHVGTPELARVAARVWEKGGSRHAPLSLLQEAYAMNSEDHRILWAVGVTRLEESDPEGLNLIARSLPGFAKKKEVEKIEEGVLHILENPNREATADLLEALGELVRGGENKAAVALFELCGDVIVSQGIAGDAWKILRNTLEKSTEREAYRKVAAVIGIAAHPDVRNPEKLFETAGIAGDLVPTEEALALLDRLLELPPGRHVFHASWGVGEILESDGEALKIRFEEKGEHKMSLSLAKTALLLLEPTDIRVKVYRDRDGMMTALKEKKADFLFHALEHMKGSAAQDDIKKLLVTLGILQPGGWAEWWKSARKEAEKDDRFDTSQIFRKVIRLWGDKKHVASMPEVDLAGALRKSLDMLFRFLDRHPDDGGRVARRYADELKVIAVEKGRTPAERVQAHLMLHRLGDVDVELFREAVAGFTRDPDLGPFTTEQQKILLAMAPEEKRGTVAGILLNSKVQTVRKEAWSILKSREGKELLRETNSILTGSPARSNAVIHVVRERIREEAGSVWALVHALIHIVEHPEKDPYRTQALDALQSEPFREAMAKKAPSEEDEQYLRNRLLNWKHSERYLFPILEALEGTTLDLVAKAVEEKRRSLRPTSEGGVLDKFGNRILMTRATLTRIRKEADSLDWDLKTTIPQEIKKAREHGDLKENAEYDAAKAKQADAIKRLEDLYGRIRLARAIEDIEIDSDEAWPGTEVVLVSNGDEHVTYWILGDGDGDLAENIVSYRAPLGMSMLGKKVGDQVGPVNDRTYRIESIHKRLPESAA